MQFHFQWEPSQIDSMSSSQASNVLNDIVCFYRYLRTNYTDKLTELQSKVDEAKKHLDACESARKRKPVIYLIAGIGIALFALLLKAMVTEGIISSILLAVLFQLLFTPLMVISVILLVVFLRTLFQKIGATQAKHEKLLSEFAQASAAHKQLDDEMMAWANLNRDCMIKSKTLLPDYYYNEEALLSMISILNNHRANTIGQALNVYLNDVRSKEQLNAQYEAIDAANRVAAAANRAASAAESAAISAKSSADNTTYMRYQ